MIHFLLDFLGIIAHIIGIAIVAVLGLAVLSWTFSRVSGYRNSYDLTSQRKKIEREGKRYRDKLHKKQKTNLKNNLKL